MEENYLCPCTQVILDLDQNILDLFVQIILEWTKNDFSTLNFAFRPNMFEIFLTRPKFGPLKGLGIHIQKKKRP